jgi:hypothetical protein
MAGIFELRSLRQEFTGPSGDPPPNGLPIDRSNRNALVTNVFWRSAILACFSGALLALYQTRFPSTTN